MAQSPQQIWFTTSKRGSRRAWTFSTYAGRAVPVKMADAELAIMSGQAIETTKPIFVGITFGKA